MRIMIEELAFDTARAVVGEHGATVPRASGFASGA
jgi:hypothetical protein